MKQKINENDHLKQTIISHINKSVSKMSRSKASDKAKSLWNSATNESSFQYIYQEKNKGRTLKMFDPVEEDINELMKESNQLDFWELNTVQPSQNEHENAIDSYLKKYNNQEKRLTASFTENASPEGFYTLDSTALIRASLVRKSMKENKSSSFWGGGWIIQ